MAETERGLSRVRPASLLPTRTRGQGCRATLATGKDGGQPMSRALGVQGPKAQREPAPSLAAGRTGGAVTSDFSAVRTQRRYLGRKQSHPPQDPGKGE